MKTNSNVRWWYSHMLQLHDNSVTPLEAGFLIEEQAPSKQTQNIKQIIHSTGNPFSYPKEITATSSKMQRTSHQQPSARSHNVLPIFQQPKMETPDICFVFSHQYMRDARLGWTFDSIFQKSRKSIFKTNCRCWNCTLPIVQLLAEDFINCSRRRENWQTLHIPIETIGSIPKDYKGEVTTQ